MNNLQNVTQLLGRLDSGDGEAAAELFPVVYEELRRLAKHKLANEKHGHTLQPTALVNEAFLRLVGGEQSIAYRSRAGFFVAASEAMRRILVDAARRKMAQKRGGDLQREHLELDFIEIKRPDELLRVHEAIDAFSAVDSPCAEIVKLHYFGGYQLNEISQLLGISIATVNRRWVYAKAWLKTFIEN